MIKKTRKIRERNQSNTPRTETLEPKWLPYPPPFQCTIKGFRPSKKKKSTNGPPDREKKNEVGARERQKKSEILGGEKSRGGPSGGGWSGGGWSCGVQTHKHTNTNTARNGGWKQRTSVLEGWGAKGPRRVGPLSPGSGSGLNWSFGWVVQKFWPKHLITKIGQSQFGQVCLAKVGHDHQQKETKQKQREREGKTGSGAQGLRVWFRVSGFSSRFGVQCCLVLAQASVWACWANCLKMVRQFRGLRKVLFDAFRPS